MKTLQLSTFVENKPGMLGKLCRILKNHGIDLRGHSLVDAMEFGIVRMIVADPEETAKVLEAEGYLCQLAEVVIVAMEDRAGAFGEILDLLTTEGVNIETTYTCLPLRKEQACLVMKVDDAERAEKVLAEAGVELVTADMLKG